MNASPLYWVSLQPDDERRLNPRRDDQEREHDGEIPPEGMLYGFEEGVSPPPNSTDDHLAEP